MEEERKEHSSDNESDITKKAFGFIRNVSSVISFISAISVLLSYLGYVSVPPDVIILVLCPSAIVYLSLDFHAIVKSDKKTKALIRLNIAVLLLILILVISNFGADSRPRVKMEFSEISYMDVDITGTATNIPDDCTLWILVYPEAAQKYYPQYGSIKNIQDGKWSIPIHIGTENNTGEKFDIVAVLADEDASDEFEVYKQNCNDGYCPGMADLPEGATICDSIEVTRI